ncbi:MAG: LapA family protein [Planctomycetota bacterium]|nr:LapA family protein [Planctomycetota bacterium]
MMRRLSRLPLLFRYRSWLASWLIFGALGLGVLIWFLVANRSRVTVQMPFGYGAWTGPLSIVILVSMALGSGWTILFQTVMGARRRMRALYHRWKQPKSAANLRADTPHLAKGWEPQIAIRRDKIEYSEKSD